MVVWCVGVEEGEIRGRMKEISGIHGAMAWREKTQMKKKKEKEEAEIMADRAWEENGYSPLLMGETGEKAADQWMGLSIYMPPLPPPACSMPPAHLLPPYPMLPISEFETMK